MLRAQRATFIFMAGALDVLALIIAFLVTWTMRDSMGNLLVSFGHLFGYQLENMVRRGAEASNGGFRQIVLSPKPLDNMSNYIWVLYLSIPSWLFFLRSQNAYDPLIRRSLRQEFGICSYAGLLGIVVLMVFMVLLKLDISRLLLVGFLCYGILFLWLERCFVLPATLRRGKGPVRHMLLIGPEAAARRFAGVLRTPAYRWSQMIGYVWDEAAEPSEYSGPERRTSLPYLGTIADLGALLDREVVDEVIMVRPSGDWATASGGVATNGDGAFGVRWSDVLELCLQRGRTVSLVDNLVPPVGAKMQATMTGALPTLVLHNTPQNTVALVVKSIMDRSVAFFALVALTPLMAVIALLIKKHDGGSVFFTQDRVGLNGRLFKFYKFRSMDVNAPQLLEDLKLKDRAYYDSINIMQEPFFKAEDGKDPRITPIGRFIRKYSIDELPQFWNVLRGDMSLVGPRPPLPKEVAELEAWQRRKLSVKGGLTCIWQATGRNEITDADEWMRLDLEYIDNWSLWLDVKLIFKTMKTLVKPRGAS